MDTMGIVIPERKTKEERRKTKEERSNKNMIKHSYLIHIETLLIR